MSERKVYVIPIMHGPGEVDPFMIDAVRDSQRTRKRLYLGIIETIRGIQHLQPSRRLDGFKVYQDGYDGRQDFSGLERVEAEDIIMKPQDVILSIVTRLGAKLVVTENKTLVDQAARLIRKTGEIRSHASDDELESLQRQLKGNAGQRDNSAAKRVTDTLRMSEQALYFFGALHDPVAALERRGLVTHVPLEVFTHLEVEDYRVMPLLLNYRRIARALSEAA